LSDKIALAFGFTVTVVALIFVIWYLANHQLVVSHP